MKIEPRSSTSTYDWGPGKWSKWVGHPQDIAERLETLIEDNDGQLTPALVVQDARDPSSILHPNFEWDDSTAAELYRTETARQLIRSVVVIGVGDHIIDSTVRGFVSVKSPENKHYFTSTVYAMQQPDLREQILKKAWRELQEWRNRYEHLQEFSTVINAMRRIDIDDLVKAEAEPA